MSWIEFELDDLPIHSALNPEIEFFATVHILEVRGVLWNSHNAGWLFGKINRRTVGTRGGLLRRFPSLKQLHLTCHKDLDSVCGGNRDWIYHDWSQMIEKGFRRLRRKYPDYQVPEVFHHQFRRRQYRTEFQQKNDGRILIST